MQNSNVLRFHYLTIQSHFSHRGADWLCGGRFLFWKTVGRFRKKRGKTMRARPPSPEPHADENEVQRNIHLKVCACCKTPGAAKKCNGCRQRAYCSKRCQKGDWCTETNARSFGKWLCRRRRLGGGKPRLQQRWKLVVAAVLLLRRQGVQMVGGGCR